MITQRVVQTDCCCTGHSIQLRTPATANALSSALTAVFAPLLVFALLILPTGARIASARSRRACVRVPRLPFASILMRIVDRRSRPNSSP
jgi:hypothetical protein